MFKSTKSKAAARLFKQQSSSATSSQVSQPIVKQDFFNQNCHRIYSCIHCRAHLANHDELISKLFQGNHGRAYLFNKVVNIGCKQAVQRELLTGLHAVADIYCDNCETTLGWKYEQAFVQSQKYKEGKYIIELVHMLKENTWDPTSYNARELLCESQASKSLAVRDFGRLPASSNMHLQARQQSSPSSVSSASSSSLRPPLTSCSSVSSSGSPTSSSSEAQSAIEMAEAVLASTDKQQDHASTLRCVTGQV